MSDVVEWLREQVDTDERIAWAVASKDWTAVGTRFPDPGSHAEEMLRGYVYDFDADRSVSADSVPDADGDGPDAVHIAEHDPDRVLRQVQAFRRILREHRRVDDDPAYIDDTWGYPQCYGCGANFHEEYNVDNIEDCPVLRNLASIYSHRPGYSEDWRPEPL